MIIRQTATHSRLRGRVVRYSGDLKSDMPGKTTQDWQRVTVDAELSEIFDHVEVGFIGKGGRRVGLGQKLCD